MGSRTDFANNTIQIHTQIKQHAYQKTDGYKKVPILKW